MRSVGGGSAATCSGESASAVWSFVTVCSSYQFHETAMSTDELLCGRGRYLLDVGLSLCAMPGLGLCITTALGAVTGGRGLAIGCCLCHGVFYELRMEDKVSRWSPG
jgi:hypothetical protein